MKIKCLPLLALSLIAFPSLTFAHPGHELKNVIHDMGHFASDPYHLSLIGLMILGAVAFFSRGRLTKAAGVATMAIGLIMISFT